jgi:Cu/Ag efflux protein CusF
MGQWIRLLAAVLVLMAAGCKHAPPVRQYAMHGEVMAIDVQSRTATIKHEKIGDWMGAMTMEYPIKNDADWSKLAVGKTIDATVFVSEGGYYVGNVRAAAQNAPAGGKR